VVCCASAGCCVPIFPPMRAVVRVATADLYYTTGAAGLENRGIKGQRTPRKGCAVLFGPASSREGDAGPNY